MDNAATIETLAKAWDDITTTPDVEETHDTYGMWTVEYDGETWAIGTDEDADNAAKENIRENVWSFRASFIADYCGYSSSMAKAIESMQREGCESCNDDVLKMIEGANGGLRGFVEDAISSDGRGRFLASYDGEEVEAISPSGEKLYLYRIN